jgi:hypothetical protein
MTCPIWCRNGHTSSNELAFGLFVHEGQAVVVETAEETPNGIPIDLEARLIQVEETTPGHRLKSVVVYLGLDSREGWTFTPPQARRAAGALAEMADLAEHQH